MLVETVKNLLAQQAPQALEKVHTKFEQIPQQSGTNPVAMAFSLAPRWFGKADIQLGDAQISQLDESWPHHPIATWQLDQLARGYIFVIGEPRISRRAIRTLLGTYLQHLCGE